MAASKKTSKKTLIDQAAMELFAGRGFAGTTIKGIAAKAGVTEGALYRHYASKEEMALKLFMEELASIQERLSASLKEAGSPEQKLRSLIRGLYQAYYERPWPLLFVILNFQNLQGDAALDDKKHIYDFIVEYARELFSSLPDEKNIELTATLVTGLTIQPIIFHYYQKLPAHPIEYADEIAEACCRLINNKFSKQRE